MEDIFMINLKKNFSELYDLANKNEFVILIPNKRLITENMLNQNFYNNHIYSISKYDEQMYINLNGKVLKFFHPKFSSFIGWKKEMTFNIKENFRTDNIIFYVIDNVCDDGGYNIQNTKENSTNSGFNSNSLIPKESMSEYLKLSKNLEMSTEEYKRCKYGMTSHGYTITGDNYFFLNYYQLMDLDSAETAGEGRVYIFPNFYVG
jgi:hypothetical protein